jgi:hypothetical protein
LNSLELGKWGKLRSCSWLIVVPRRLPQAKLNFLPRLEVSWRQVAEVCLRSMHAF